MPSGCSAWTVGARINLDSGTEKMPTRNRGFGTDADSETAGALSGTGAHDHMTRSPLGFHSSLGSQGLIGAHRGSRATGLAELSA